MSREKRNPLISVIIPVFNMEKYVGQCIESVVNQTYHNLEILIMEGKSGDNSLQICREWENKDSRIVLVSRKDGGLGPARNYGIAMAKGDFLFFVDSDDYLPECAIEILLSKVTDDDIDVVAGGYQPLNETEGTLDIVTPTRNGCDEFISSVQERRTYIRRGIIAVWGKLYRTSFWKRTGLEMPVGLAEDAAIFPSVASTANKIVCCDSVTYIYRKGRQGSLFDCISKHKEIYRIIDWYVNRINAQGEFSTYRNALLFYSKMHISVWLNSFKEAFQNNETCYKEMEEIFFNKLKECFGQDCLKDRVLLFPFGSYNVRWICNKALPKSNRNHMAFTSMVSQFFNNSVPSVHLQSDNTFRQQALLNDCEQTVKKRLQSKSDDIDYVILDFMDDVCDVLILEDGSILTRSEAYEEAQKENISVKEIVKGISVEYFEMWKIACGNFCELLKNIDCEIILLQTRFVEKYYDGNIFCEFGFSENIQERNRCLERMEEFFAQHCKNILHTVSLPEDARYADAHSSYGCHSEYLCYKAQIRMVEKILDIAGLA